MKKYFIFIFVLLLDSVAFSDHSITEKGFDVLRYSLDLKIKMTDGSLKGKNTITILPVRKLNYINLHSLGLKIFDAFLGEKRINVLYNHSREEITLETGTLKANDTVSIVINYEYDKEYNRKPGRKGYYYFKKKESGNPFSDILENLAYTMSEPSDARCWFPCWDEPNDKTFCDISLTVEKEYTAVSNGLLESENLNPDGTKTFRWKCYYPISTYLMSFAISRYSTFSQYYMKSNPTKSKMQIQYYFWPPDSNGDFFNAVRSFERVPNMIQVFSEIFGEYPFEKYGMVAVAPFDYGGEEHQTITTIHRYWLYGDEIGIAHELAHQWWGDMVTCGDWKDIWLNESFATYSEAIYIEKTESKSDFIEKIKSYYKLGKEWEAAVYNPEGQGRKLFSDIVYQKGALVLHTLRNIIGDSLFFKLLLKYREKYSYSYAKTEDFINLTNEVCEQKMNWFFNQYIYGKGWPKIQYSWRYNRDDKKLFLSIRQIQPESWPVYRFPIEVKINNDDRKILVTQVEGKLRKQNIEVDCKWIPESVTLNPNQKIFLEIVK